MTKRGDADRLPIQLSDADRGSLRLASAIRRLTLPGIVRMTDVFLFRRKITLHTLTALLLWPFELLETRWGWPGHFGDMPALIAKKAAS